MEFNWQIVVGSLIGFCGAAFGSVGGVGGGGIFVPMLTLIIGFDPKSATAISKCTKLLISLLYIKNIWIITVLHISNRVMFSSCIDIINVFILLKLKLAVM